jgi:hypothetical protein
LAILVRTASRVGCVRDMGRAGGKGGVGECSNVESRVMTARLRFGYGDTHTQAVGAQAEQKPACAADLVAECVLQCTLGAATDIGRREPDLLLGEGHLHSGMFVCSRVSGAIARDTEMPVYRCQSAQQAGCTYIAGAPAGEAHTML